MAEGAERFRGLWEDEMFARQSAHTLRYQVPGTPKGEATRIVDIMNHRHSEKIFLQVR